MNLIRNRKNGFTLIELLVVIAIIGVLSSIVLSSLNKSKIKARDTAKIITIREIGKALEIYHLDYGNYIPVNTGNNNGIDDGGVFLQTTLTNGGYMKVPNLSSFVAMYAHICDTDTICAGVGAINNADALTAGCGNSPLPKAALFFILESGPSSYFRQWGGMNVLCFY